MPWALRANAERQRCLRPDPYKDAELDSRNNQGILVNSAAAPPMRSIGVRIVWTTSGRSLRIRISTLAGTSVNFATKDGIVVVDGSQATSFTVNVLKGVTSLTTTSGVAQLHVGSVVKQVAAGESATAGTPTPRNNAGMGGGALAALLLAVGGAVAGVLYAAFHNNDLNFGGSVTVISPSR